MSNSAGYGGMNRGYGSAAAPPANNPFRNPQAPAPAWKSQLGSGTSATGGSSGLRDKSGNAARPGVGIAPPLPALKQKFAAAAGGGSKGGGPGNGIGGTGKPPGSGLSDKFNAASKGALSDKFKPTTAAGHGPYGPVTKGQEGKGPWGPNCPRTGPNADSVKSGARGCLSTKFNNPDHREPVPALKPKPPDTDPSGPKPGSGGPQMR
jgi:hypothetical protein